MAMGGQEDALRRKIYNVGAVEWRGPLSDNASEWTGVTVGSAGRVTKLESRGQGLSGALPGEVGALSDLVYLHLGSNRVSPYDPPKDVEHREDEEERIQSIALVPVCSNASDSKRDKNC